MSAPEIFLAFVPSTENARTLLAATSVRELLRSEQNASLRLEAIELLSKLRHGQKPRIELQFSDPGRFLRAHLLVRLFLARIGVARLERAYQRVFQEILTELWEICVRREVIEPSDYQLLLERVGITVKHPMPDEWQIAVEDLMPIAAGMRWKLASFAIDRGQIRLRTAELREVILPIILLIEQRRPPISPQQLQFDPIDQAQLDSLAFEMQNEMTIIPTTTVHEYPPCIRRILQDLKERHVGHQPRTILATYLLSINRPIPEIIETLMTDPRFDRNTRYDQAEVEYQIQSLLRRSTNERSARYLFGCRSVKDAGYCFPDQFCQRMINSEKISNYPQNYRKKKDQVLTD